MSEIRKRKRNSSSSAKDSEREQKESKENTTLVGEAPRFIQRDQSAGAYGEAAAEMSKTPNPTLTATGVKEKFD
jgi:hypothetical protein